MSIETLLHVENDLRQQNALVDKRVASLNGRFAKLRAQQQALEKTNKKVGAAKDWEVRQRESRAREYARAVAATESKRHQIGVLARKGEALRREISTLEAKMKSLDREKRILEARYSHPSLREAVLNEAEKMGPVPQHLVQKAIDNMVPELQEGLREARIVHRRLERSSHIVSLLTSLCVYMLGLSVLCLCYRSVRIMQTMLTLPRMLFTIDMAFVILWGLTMLCYGTILEDPLQVMAIRHNALSVVIQLLMMFSLIGNVMLRCLLFTSSADIWSFVELFWSVLLAQHYYQAVWVPFLLDQGFKSTALSYVGYLIVSGSLAIYRARSIARLSCRWRREHELSAGKFKSTGDWLRQKLEDAVQYCEDMLTTGRETSRYGADMVAGSPSAEGIRSTSRLEGRGLQEVYDYFLPYARPPSKLR